MKKLIVIFSLAFFFPALSAFGSKYDNLESFVISEINHQVIGFNTVQEDEKGIFSGDNFYFNKVRLRVRATVGLDVPWFASFEIKPFIELHWKRKLPSNRVSYKP